MPFKVRKLDWKNACLALRLFPKVGLRSKDWYRVTHGSLVLQQLARLRVTLLQYSLGIARERWFAAATLIWMPFSSSNEAEHRLSVVSSYWPFAFLLRHSRALKSDSCLTTRYFSASLSWTLTLWKHSRSRHPLAYLLGEPTKNMPLSRTILRDNSC